ncbi:hypothetical protein [Undibacterium sp. TJN19]|uniref:hypothetical protein n=1 Tax=Undibacterium sp. TJN19 TaxID=3413055 RepID=UPI003BEF8438
MAASEGSDHFYISAKEHDLDDEAGAGRMILAHGKRTYAARACLATGTLVAMADGSQERIEDLQAGETGIATAGLDLKFVPGTVSSLVKSNTAEFRNSIYLRYQDSDGAVLERVVNMDYPFLLADKTLVPAYALQASDQLQGGDGRPVSIDAIVMGNYIGQFWELICGKADTASLDGHLLISEGVVTGDASIIMPDQSNAQRPSIGSSAWLEKNGSEEHTYTQPIQLVDGIFIPAAAFAVAIPAYASAFLPEVQAAVLDRHAPKEPTSSLYLPDLCEHLVEFVFEPRYYDIRFHFNWYDNTVNAYAWVNPASGQQTVYLSGGLARIKGFAVEGLALALAHEVGHLLGWPLLPGGVTCEGRADWFAAAVALRAIWFGEEHAARLPKAIAQLELLYSYLQQAKEQDDTLDITPPTQEANGQPYPDNHSRITILQTALISNIAPECSFGLPADGADTVEGTEGIDDGLHAEVNSKIAGPRDRQRKKSNHLAPLTTAGKTAGARDRQRKKDGGGDDRPWPDDDSDPRPLPSKLAGARDRQAKKDYRFSALAEDILSGDHDLDHADEEYHGLHIADGSEQFEEDDFDGSDEDQFDDVTGENKISLLRDLVDELLALREQAQAGYDDDDEDHEVKISGARDRQRRKVRRLSADVNADVSAKLAGARDRQRKKLSLHDEDLSSSDVSDDTGLLRDLVDELLALREQAQAGYGDDEYEQAEAKVSGARDRQRKKKYLAQGVGVAAKFPGIRDLGRGQKREPRNMLAEASDEADDADTLLEHIAEFLGSSELETTIKTSGTRDLQRRKKTALLGAELDTKRAGNRDRQRKEKWDGVVGDDDALAFHEYDEVDDLREQIAELLENSDLGDAAKISGARDRQRRRKPLQLGAEPDDAKRPGARDRQKKKKMALQGEAEVDFDEADDLLEQIAELLENYDLGTTAKLSGARDRQRRKNANTLAAKDNVKIYGPRDRQRKKRMDYSIDDDDALAFHEPDEADDLREQIAELLENADLGDAAKVSGARDRQRRRKPLHLGAEPDSAKRSGARDRQKKKKMVLQGEAESDFDEADDLREQIAELLENYDPGTTAKVSGARDRQRRKNVIALTTMDDAKIYGPRDRQRKKKSDGVVGDEDNALAFHESYESDEPDEADVLREQIAELLGNSALGETAKRAGARDRQRRKK